MSAKEFGMLLALGAIWGASFMFIKVGGAEIGPFAFVEIRLALAGLVLLAVSATRSGIVASMRAHWRQLAVMGLLNCVVPYTLITWGETHISSGLAAIYNATTPLWMALLGLVWVWGERLSPGRVVRARVGLAGGVLGGRQ